jgi:histidine triad (HIT) family protein
MDCLFCKIIKGEIPSNKVYEDEYVYAFRDIDPKAPTHVLIIPKKHIGSTNELETEDTVLLGKVYEAVKKIAVTEGVDQSGYRVVSNTLSDGGQTVAHLHFHLLGGRSLTWPPG